MKSAAAKRRFFVFKEDGSRGGREEAERNLGFLRLSAISA